MVSSLAKRSLPLRIFTRKRFTELADINSVVTSVLIRCTKLAYAPVHLTSTQTTLNNV